MADVLMSLDSFKPTKAILSIMFMCVTVWESALTYLRVYRPRELLYAVKNWIHVNIEQLWVKLNL